MVKLTKLVDGEIIELTTSEVAEFNKREVDHIKDTTKRANRTILNNRRGLYKDVGSQLDIILQYLDTLSNLTPDLRDLINSHKTIKINNPFIPE